jgi:hypothetical protein
LTGLQAASQVEVSLRTTGGARSSLGFGKVNAKEELNVLVPVPVDVVAGPATLELSGVDGQGLPLTVFLGVRIVEASAVMGVQVALPIASSAKAAKKAYRTAVRKLTSKFGATSRVVVAVNITEGRGEPRSLIFSKNVTKQVTQALRDAGYRGPVQTDVAHLPTDSRSRVIITLVR